MEQTDEEFEYINLQGTFREMEPCSPEKIIVRMNTPNERQNYYNMIDFIANEARRTQMTDDYILTKYNLRSGLRKFGEKGCNATMKLLQ